MYTAFQAIEEFNDLRLHDPEFAHMYKLAIQLIELHEAYTCVSSQITLDFVYDKTDRYVISLAFYYKSKKILINIYQDGSIKHSFFKDHPDLDIYEDIEADYEWRTKDQTKHQIHPCGIHKWLYFNYETWRDVPEIQYIKYLA